MTTFGPRATARDAHLTIKGLTDEIKQLKQEIKRLQGNFSHFHICNHIDDACALCGLPVENEVHLRSR